MRKNYRTYLYSEGASSEASNNWLSGLIGRISVRRSALFLLPSHAAMHHTVHPPSCNQLRLRKSSATAKRLVTPRSHNGNGVYSLTRVGGSYIIIHIHQSYLTTDRGSERGCEIFTWSPQFGRPRLLRDFLCLFAYLPSCKLCHHRTWLYF